jgi:hypothetical protein
MERVCCKETLDIVNTVLSNGAAVLMSTWILTENFRKLLLKHGNPIREIAKEINDFCSGPNTVLLYLKL